MSADTVHAADRLIRLPEVKRKVGLGKTIIYEMIGEGRFPQPFKLSAAASCWSEREIDTWIASITKRELKDI